MRTRRGLSAVVGTVFAIIALSTTIAYVSYSMSILDKYNQTVLGTNQQSLDTSREKFQVTAVTVVNNKFNITVTNTGSLPINFTKLWVQNTTATDWISSFAPRTKVVSPGGILYNIGQNIPLSALSTKAYHIKLVTARGNTQEFNVNSASTAPLNIQLLAIPTTVPSGLKSELVMIVTNNGSNILTNPAPASLGAPSGSASCSAGSVSPPSYNTLSPGSTAIFKWDVRATGQNSTSCTYAASLQNGYPGQTVQATITVTTVTLSSTNYAQTAGILTINYTSWKWSQGGGWQMNSSMPRNTGTVFSLQLTNNNATGTFYLSKFSALIFTTGGDDWVYSYIVNATNVAPRPPSLTAFSCAFGDYCITMAPQQTITLYFGANAPRGSTIQSNDINPRPAIGFLVPFGKFDTSQNGNGRFYGQNIPYIGFNLV